METTERWFRKEAKRCLSAYFRGTPSETRNTLTNPNQTAILLAAISISMQIRLEEIARNSPLTTAAIQTVEKLWLEIVGRSERPTWEEDEVRRVLIQKALGLTAAEAARTTSTSLSHDSIQLIFDLAQRFSNGETPDVINPNSQLIEGAIVLVYKVWLIERG